jgi:hypothetical protein
MMGEPTDQHKKLAHDEILAEKRKKAHVEWDRKQMISKAAAKAAAKMAAAKAQMAAMKKAKEDKLAF